MEIIFYRPLKRFGDSVDIGHFRVDGDEESKVIVSPRQGDVNDFQPLARWEH